MIKKYYFLCSALTIGNSFSSFWMVLLKDVMGQFTDNFSIEKSTLKAQAASTELLQTTASPSYSSEQALKLCMILDHCSLDLCAATVAILIQLTAMIQNFIVWYFAICFTGFNLIGLTYAIGVLILNYNQNAKARFFAVIQPTLIILVSIVLRFAPWFSLFGLGAFSLVKITNIPCLLAQMIATIIILVKVKNRMTLVGYIFRKNMLMVILTGFNLILYIMLNIIPSIFSVSVFSLNILIIVSSLVCLIIFSRQLFCRNSLKSESAEFLKQISKALQEAIAQTYS